MKDIPDKSVNLILCDLPYGTTKNKWDTTINLVLLWEQYTRIIKKRGCVALFAQTPFDKILGASNLGMLKYEWIWEKPMAVGRLNCNFAPMKAHENILIFSKSAACYVKNKDNAMIYNPQMTAGKPYKAISGRASTNYDTKWSKEQLTINTGTRYPRDIQKVAHDKEKYHPTQKPVALLEYLIKTYTNENETVLDNCMGSGSTGVACVNTNRNFIGIELDSNYFNIAKDRIETTQKEVNKSNE
jgi:site-specific DNA-methyltransferase (adenine-specific)